MEREVGGGIGMGNTCKPMAVSFQYMTKSTAKKKKKRVTPKAASTLNDKAYKFINHCLPNRICDRNFQDFCKLLQITMENSFCWVCSFYEYKGRDSSCCLGS